MKKQKKQIMNKFYKLIYYNIIRMSDPNWLSDQPSFFQSHKTVIIASVCVLVLLVGYLIYRKYSNRGIVGAGTMSTSLTRPHNINFSNRSPKSIMKTTQSDKNKKVNFIPGTKH